MKLRTFIILFAAFVLIFNYLVAGRLISFILPYADQIIGTIYCNWGGGMYQPTLSLGGLQIPYPVADDLAYVSLPTLALAGLILRYKKEWRTWKSVLAVFFIVFVGMVVVEKSIGFVMVSIAENSYGMKNCLQGIQIAGQELPYSVLSPLYVIGLVLLIPGIIISVVKLKKQSSKKSDA